MIYDKIKVYVTRRIANILAKDADSFEFRKRDGVTPNKNALLTALIVNYSDEFRARQENLHKKIRSTLSEKTRLSEAGAQELCYKIAEVVNREFASDSVENFSAQVSLKPTKESQPVIDYTEEYLLGGCSLSEYFRNMFASYASLSQDKREEIIFKPVHDLLSEAIREGKKVFITTSGRDRKTEISPYAFARSKEEMHVYLLASAGGECKTFRLSRIKSVNLLSTDAVFSDEERETYAKMQEYGPQFSYTPGETEIVVRLTEQGIYKFRNLYVHRPMPKKINGNEYVFDCSPSQVIQYFERFGNDAYIVSPVEIRNIVFNFHRRAVKMYKDGHIE